MNSVNKEKEAMEHDVARLRARYGKLEARCEALSQKLARLEERNKQLSEENFSFNYLLQTERNKSSGFDY